MVRRRGFTIIELLIVIGLIAVLAAFLMPAIRKARDQARMVTCESNLRQITTAYVLYARDNLGAFLPPDSTIAQAGLPANISNGQVILPLYSLAHSVNAFHCPGDDRAGALSYSMNDYLGGSFPASAHVIRMPEVNDSARVFVFIEEVNLNPKVLNNSGGFALSPYPSPIWYRHYPAILHGSGTCMSFLDNHCEYIQWGDPRTLTLAVTGMTVQFPSTPGNLDLVRLQWLGGDANAPGY